MSTKSAYFKVKTFGGATARQLPTSVETLIRMQGRRHSFGAPHHSIVGAPQIIIIEFTSMSLKILRSVLGKELCPKEPEKFFNISYVSGFLDL